MRGIDRRRFLEGSVASLCTLLHPPPAAASEDEGGCSLSLSRARALDRTSTGIGVVGEKLGFTTGNAAKDRMLGRALVRISQTFDERPTFGFVDDSSSPNAYANGGAEGLPGTWGVVRFGHTLFRDLTNKFDDDGIAILAVIAHEFAHVAQHHRKVMATLKAGQKTVRRSELHADLVAGYYLGTRKMANGSIKLRSAGLALYSIGDYSYNDPDHHGTPQQRVEAAEYGYRLATEGRSYSEAFNRGIDWVFERYHD